MTSPSWGWWPSPRISHDRSWAQAARPTSVLTFRPGALHAERVPAEGRVVSPARVKANTGRRAQRASRPPLLRAGGEILGKDPRACVNVTGTPPKSDRQSRQKFRCFKYSREEKEV